MFLEDPHNTVTGGDAKVSLPEPLVALRDDLDDVRSMDVSALSPDELRAVVVELCAAQSRLEAARLAAIAQLDASMAWAGVGALSAGSWLARHTPLDAVQGRRDARVAKRLRDTPGTRAALEEGSLSTGAAAVIADRASADPAAFEEVEDAIVQAAKVCERSQLNQVLKLWDEQVRGDGRVGADLERQHQRRGLSVSQTLDGMVVLDGTLDPVDGAEVMAILHTVDQHLFRQDRETPLDGDARTARQRRADALVELLRAGAGSLARGDDGPIVPGCATSTTIIIRDQHLPGLRDLLAAAEEHRRESDTPAAFLPRSLRPTTLPGNPRDTVPVSLDGRDLVLDRASLDYLLCDTKLAALITGPHDVPLDLGRTQRTANRAQRRALRVRDKHCIFPGCDRPAHWCDAHHITYWDNGGATNLRNLALLCRAHHRLIHKPDWGIRIDDDGHPTITYLGMPQPRNTHPPPLAPAA